MAKRINRAIELLENDQPIYYTGLHSFSRDFLTYEQGKKDSATWADYINTVSYTHLTLPTTPYV